MYFANRFAAWHEMIPVRYSLVEYLAKKSELFAFIDCSVNEFAKLLIANSGFTKSWRQKIKRQHLSVNEFFRVYKLFAKWGRDDLQGPSELACKPRHKILIVLTKLLCSPFREIEINQLQRATGIILQ